MCSDPDSPNPSAFSAMRCFSITTIVFGVLMFLSALSQIQGAGAGEPCYVCPTGAVDYDQQAGFTCDSGGDSSCDPATGPATLPYWCAENPNWDNTQASCEANGGSWTAYTCGDSTRFWLGTGVREGSRECNAAQTLYVDTCCTAGDPPPASNAVFNMLATFLVSILMIISGVLLSCCGGVVSDGKMKAAMTTSSIATIMHFVFAILTIIGLGTVGGMTDMIGAEAVLFFQIYLVVVIVWEGGMMLLLTLYICAIQRARSSGIGKVHVVGGPEI